MHRPISRGVSSDTLLTNSLGDGSTLTLDFTTGVLDPRLTFTRNSTGTYINSQGYVATMAAAPTNDPTKARFDYDPTTLAPRGLLIEGAATNICEQGQYCWGNGNTQSWGRSAQIRIDSVNGTGGSPTVPRIDGPDGGSLTGTSVSKDSGSTFVRLNIAVPVSASTTYTFSAYVRAPSGGNPYIRLAAFNGGTWLNTTGGTTASGITITNVSGGGSVFNGVPSTAWVRVWVTFTTQAGQTSATLAFYPDVDTSNAATMYVWGTQVETGSGPSSVILTGASTASRAADNCVMAIANLPGFNATQGTMFQSWRDSTAQDTSTIQEWAFGFGLTSAAGFGIYVSNAVSGTFGVFAGSSNTGDAGAAGTYNINGINKAALAINVTTVPNTGTISLSANGSAAVSGTRLDGYNQAQTFSLGQRNSNQRYLNGWIQQFKYWPTALSNETLQSLTT